jgi:predicted DNA-binding transcriptional regulator YafY
LEVSPRTIYRDIADLQANGVPIDGERGVGYLLRDDFFIPALALSALEMDALRWGVGFAKAHADEALVEVARDVLTKLNISSAPTPLFLAGALTKAQRSILQCAREAVTASLRLEIGYISLAGTSNSPSILNAFPPTIRSRSLLAFAPSPYAPILRLCSG